MSAPSTPSHARSSPAASPTASTNGQHAELTPRSKIKAMLAAIDDDSDENTQSSPTRPLSTTLPVRNNNSSPAKALSSDEEDEDVRPRGKLAARMKSLADNERSNEPEAEADGDAYSRVKLRLLEKKSRQESEPASQSEKEKTPEKPIMKRRFLVKKKAKTNASAAGSDSENLSRGSSESLPATRDKTNEIDTATILPENEINDDAESDSDADPQTLLSGDRFKALVERARKEREAREAEEEKKRGNREEQLASQIMEDFIADENSDDAEGAGQKLTQETRPARKASKKAIEEMKRETQRMSRNMQLTHQAIVRKKISKASFLEKFKKGGKKRDANAESQPSSSTLASSATPSDAEKEKGYETPPSSPSQADLHKNTEAETFAPAVGPLEALAPSLDRSMLLGDLADAPTAKEPTLPSPEGKGKEKMVKDPEAIEQRRIVIHAPSNPISLAHSSDSESDLEIIEQDPKKSRIMAVFDRLPEKKDTESRSRLTQRALANLKSPGKQKNSRPMNSAQLQMSLRRKAREQAAKEREEKIQDLRERGIIVQTAEERQKDQLQVEDMLEKARREAEELKQKEKEASRKEKLAKGEELSDDSSDEDFQDDKEAGENDADADESELDLSGSEDEEVDAEKVEEGAATGMFDEEASESDEEEENADEVEQEAEIDPEQREAQSDEEDALLTNRPIRRTKARRVLDDEEEGGEAEPTERAPTEEQNAVQSVQQADANPFAANPFAAMNGADNLPMGLSQAFAASMADSQSQQLPMGTQEEQSSFAMPPPDFPVHDLESPTQTRELLLGDSTQDNLPPTPSQNLPTTTQGNFDFHQLEEFDMPEPSQDAGFALSSPVGNRFVTEPASTVDTVALSPVQVLRSPSTKKARGRLQRGKAKVATFSDDEGSESPVSDANDGVDGDYDVSANAFDVMKKALKKQKKREEFNKKRSEAKEMVEEQAEESEDEYAGLGGASDDDSGEEDEELKKLIDEGEVNVDESKLAALFANKERESDEKAIEKLYKDIQSGGLRRKRAASFDVSDSEDEAEDRRRRKRAEFARMRKALLQDANVSKIASNPKKEAFLRAIQGRDSDDEADLGFEEEGPEVVPNSQQDTEAQSKPEANAAAAQVAGSKRKRPLEDASASSLNRAPAAKRRAALAGRKPASLAEMRQSVSFLLEDPKHDAARAAGASENIASSSPVPSDNEADDEHEGEPRRSSSSSSPKHRRTGSRDGEKASAPAAVFAARPRRNRLGRSGSAVARIVDRLSLKRQGSAQSSASEEGGSGGLGGRLLAFHNPSASFGGFANKVPSLLRRATTGQVGAGAADEHGISKGRASMGAKPEGVVKRGGPSKRCSINYVSREAERRKLIEGVEKRREESRRRVAEGRKGMLGVLAAGRFD